MSRALTDLMVRDRLITPAQYQQAIDSVGKDPNASPVRFLVQKKFISESKLLDYLGRKYNLHSINLTKFEIDRNVLRYMSAEQARKYQVIPIQAKASILVVAVWDPTVLANLEDLRFITKMGIEAVLTSISSFEETINKYYGSAATVDAAVAAMEKEKAKIQREGGDPAAEIKFEVHDIDQGTTEVDAPVIALVNGILGEGIRRNASDIHVEPYEKRFRVRLRIDGALVEIAQIPLEMKRAVVARFKIMSRMDIAESRIPQDGRIKLKTSGREIDFRVNTLPGLFGEKVVLRMLSQGNLQLDMKKLGFETKQLETFKKGIYSPNGLVLVTGPTGSGKTTTLYSALAELNQITDNISTAEDPVEYNLEGINQVQVNKDIGLTFASVLRALLRQDPDTILVGEIRDYETAEVSIQAALTGHLVLSTLHTNDAPSTVTRLMNMGVEPFLVTSSVNTIVAQRLLRKICVKCKQEQSVPAERLIGIGFSEEYARQLKCYAGKGCGTCNNTGYKGRVAIYEVLDFSTNLKEMVLKGATSIELRKQAVAEGMKTLRMSALSRVADGTTSLSEALGATMEE